jgi:hypothetical protein
MERTCKEKFSRLCLIEKKNSMTQQEYLSNWHDSFVNYVNQILATIASVEKSSQATEEDKQGFEMVKVLFRCKDVQDVERDLAEGVVRQSTLDKIERIDKEFADILVDHVDTIPLRKQLLKQLLHRVVENNKAAEEMRLNALNIPVIRYQ